MMLLLKAALVVSGLCLATGLALHVGAVTDLSATLLAAGLMILMVIPVARVLVAAGERLREQDWQFVAVTAVVLVELSIALWLASLRV